MICATLRLAHTLLQASDPLLTKSAVLICHGLFGSKQNWKSMAHSIHRSTCGTVCTVDMRNHGSSPHSLDMSYISMGNDLIELVNDLKLDEVCLVGHSMGGKAVMCAALLQPNRFDRLMILDSSPGYTPRAHRIMPYLRLMLHADLFRAERESDGGLNGVRDWLMEEWKCQIPDESMRKFLLTNLAEDRTEFTWRANLNAIQSCWHHIVGFPDLELRGHTFDRPTLFVSGGRSDYIPLNDFPAIRKYFPQARLLSMPKAGHWLHVDDPYTVLSLITAFIKGSVEEFVLFSSLLDLTEDALKMES